MFRKSNERESTLTDRFLEEARATSQPVNMYLVNGYQLKGEVEAFDAEAILFNHKDAYQLVMRSGVASMYPIPNTGPQASAWWRSFASEAARRHLMPTP